MKLVRVSVFAKVLLVVLAVLPTLAVVNICIRMSVTISVDDNVNIDFYVMSGNQYLQHSSLLCMDIDANCLRIRTNTFIRSCLY